MNKKITVGLIAFLAIAAVAVYASSRNAASTTTNVAQETKTKIEQKPIRVGIVIYPGFAPFNLAKEKGFFEKEGSKVEIIQSADPNQLLSALASGDIQMLTCSADCAALIADAKIPAKQIFSTDESAGADGVVVKNNISRIEYLKGKTVYLPLGFPGHFLIRTLAERAGLNSQDIKLEQMDSDQVGAAFVAGKIDAGVTWEPWLSKAAQRKDGKVLVTSKDEPGIIVDTVFARSELLQSRRDEVKAVARGYFDAVEYWKANANDANSIMAKSIGVSPEEFAIQMTASKLSDYSYSLTKFDKTKPGSVYELTNKASKFYLEDGIIKAPVDAEAITDSSILQDLYK